MRVPAFVSQAAVGLLVASLWLVSTAGPSQGAESPATHRGVIEEQTQRSLSLLRLRFEPMRDATPGYCRTLGVDALEVTVDGKRVAKQSLHLDRERPPTLHALVIDNSASVVDELGYAKHTASEYVDRLDPARDDALVMTFDENVVLVQSPTSDHRTLLDAIARIRPGSRTSMLDALYYAMQELDAHHERPVLILLTDGSDTSSLYGEAEIGGQLALRPDLTVFTVALGETPTPDTKANRELLERLARASQGKAFEQAGETSLRQTFSEIYGILESEAVLTVVDPDPYAEPERIRVRSKDRGCAVRVLGRARDAASQDDAKRQPLPQPYPTLPTSIVEDLSGPTYDTLVAHASATSVAPECVAQFPGGRLEPRWTVTADENGVRGCGPDVTLDFGRLYAPGTRELFEHNGRLRLTARSFELPIVPFDALPQSPEQALDALAAGVLARIDAGEPTASWTREGTGHARPFADEPSLVHGITFLRMRPDLARVEFFYPDYRAWALGRLRDRAEAELALLEQRYRDQFPDANPSNLRAAARESEEGQRIATAARTPAEIDLQPYLAAWLGDISAHDLFRRWESLRIDRAIAGDDGDVVGQRFLEAWKALHDVFFAPSYARELTLLVPVHDPGCDCVGFWRVVLPRPAWLKARVAGLTAGREVSGDYLDLVADLPVGFLAFQRLVDETPGLLDLLHSSDYRADPVRYQLLGASSGHDPAHAFSQCGAEVVLVTPERGSAVVDRDAMVFRVETKPRGEGDPALPVDFANLEIEATPFAINVTMAEDLRQAANRILGVEDPTLVASTDPDTAEPAPPAEDEAEPSASAASAPPERVLAPPETATVVAVQVPVQVLHRGEPLRGLTAENFELIDKGQRRRLTGFEIVDLGDARSSGEQEGAQARPPATRRHLLFLFDLSAGEPVTIERAREAVLATLDRLHPSDLAAVVFYAPDTGARLAVDFTDDRDRIRTAMNRLGDVIPTLAAEQRETASPVGDSMQDAESEFARTGSDDFGSQAGGNSGEAMEHFRSIMVGVDSSRRRAERQRIFSMCRDLGNVARWLNGIPGRKQVILLSAGFDRSMLSGTDNARQRQELTEAQEGGRLWEIDTAQQTGDSALRSAVDHMVEQFRRSDSVIQAIELPGRRRSGSDGLFMIAHGTDGELFHVENDTAPAVERLLRRTGVYYILFFQPGVPEGDGGYRKLKVRLRDVPRGTKAFYREGYYVLPPPRPSRASTATPSP